VSKKLVLCVFLSFATLSASNSVLAQCNQYTDECDEPERTYSDTDIENVVFVAVSDAFQDCTKMAEPTKRLDCYDKAMIDFGYKIEGMTR
jgi:hypothetical protein